MSNFNEINFENLFRVMTPEEREAEKQREIKRQEYYERVKKNFLNLARSLPGREYETPNDPLTTIKGDIEGNKIVNLRVLTSNRALTEGIDNIFSNNNNNYFEYSINNNVTLKSDTIPENFEEIMSWLLVVDDMVNEDDHKFQK